MNNFIRHIVPIYLLLITSCSFINQIPVVEKLIPDCERLPSDLSYEGIVSHFGRDPDFTAYKTIERSDTAFSYKYIIYYWVTCNETSALAYIFERRYEINEYGMSIRKGGKPSVELIQINSDKLRMILNKGEYDE